MVSLYTTSSLHAVYIWYTGEVHHMYDYSARGLNSSSSIKYDDSQGHCIQSFSIAIGRLSLVSSFSELAFWLTLEYVLETRCCVQHLKVNLRRNDKQNEISGNEACFIKTSFVLLTLS
jgi:hypothetical protein